jgi:two-component system, LytTR family, response regulator
MRNPFAVLIVDDEPVARQTLRLLLEKDADVRAIDECANGLEAVAAIAKHRPDLVLLDIQMPGLNGFEVLEKLPGERFPEIIFVTAYDQYAIRAFEMHARDYLLKPFTDARFYAALAYAKQQLATNRLQATSQQLLDLAEYYASARLECPPAANGYLSRFLIRSNGRVDLVNVADVDWIEAEGNYALIHVNGKASPLREKIIDLEAKLDPHRFLRIHRSLIVQVDRIKELKPRENGSYALILHNGKSLTLSRSFRDKVLAALKAAP